MSNDLQKAGSAPHKPERFGILYQDRFFTGLWTQRSPLRDAASPYLQSRYYGSRLDSLIDGENVELTTKLTLARRPGHSVYNNQTFGPIRRFFSYRNFTGSTETICVLADQDDGVYKVTSPSTKTLLFSKSPGAGQTSFLSVGNNLYMGNGVDEKQIDGCSGTVSNWGIAGPSNAPN